VQRADSQAAVCVSRRIPCRHPGLKVLYKLRSRLVVPNTLGATALRHRSGLIRRALTPVKDARCLILHRLRVPEIELVTIGQHMVAVTLGEIRFDCVRETHSHSSSPPVLVLKAMFLVIGQWYFTSDLLRATAATPLGVGGAGVSATLTGPRAIITLKSPPAP
jgi:hypothetical protein